MGCINMNVCTQAAQGRVCRCGFCFFPEPFVGGLKKRKALGTPQVLRSPPITTPRVCLILCLAGSFVCRSMRSWHVPSCQVGQTRLRIHTAHGVGRRVHANSCHCSKSACGEWELPVPTLGTCFWLMLLQAHQPEVILLTKDVNGFT